MYAIISHRKNMKFNMLMCYCIGKAASNIKEYYLLLIEGKLQQYNSIAVNTIDASKDGIVSSCDVPFSDELSQFNKEYLQLTKQVRKKCVNNDLTQRMVIGTSALVQYEIDGAVAMCSGILNNPFLIWGKYKRLLLNNNIISLFSISSYSNGWLSF